MSQYSTGQATAHCHKKVKEVAIGLCNETYELVMSKDQVWAEWKRQNPELVGEALRQRFVEKNWGKFVGGARATMARLLTQPIDEALKEQIQEALILDASLIRGRQNPATVLGQAGGQS